MSARQIDYHKRLMARTTESLFNPPGQRRGSSCNVLCCTRFIIHQVADGYESVSCISVSAPPGAAKERISLNFNYVFI